MEKAAKATLRQLKEVCFRSLDPESERRDEYFDDITTMVTLSIMALQSHNMEEAHSISVAGTSHDSIRALLETAALEGLRELGTKEVRTSDTQQTSPYTVGSEADDFWSHCYSLSQFSSTALKNRIQPSQIISSLHCFSLGTSRLLTAFSSVGKAVLDEQQILVFLSHLCDNFWSQEAKRLSEQITLTKINEYIENSTADSGTNVAMLTRIMATPYCLLSMHYTVKTSLVDQKCLDLSRVGDETKSLGFQQNRAIDQWLCRSMMDPLLDLLTTVAPKLLLTTYQGALEQDKEALYMGAELGGMTEAEHLTVKQCLCQNLAQEGGKCLVLNSRVGVQANINPSGR